MEKIPLEFLKSKIDPDPITGLLVLNFDAELRSPKSQKKYEEYKSEIIKDGFTPDQIIRQKFFPTTIKNFLYPRNFILVESEFPYDLVDADHHYILWIDSNNQETIKKAIEFEEFKFAGSDYIYFQNTSQNQSVELTHVHFLVKK